MASEKEIQDSIRKARPSLKLVAPLAYYICVGYVVVNLILGIGMMFLYQSSIPLAVANLLTYQAWGIIFLGLGVSGCWALLRNDWRTVQLIQLYSLAVKAVWAIALIIRCVTAPETILITAVWLFFAYIQVITFIHFYPPAPLGIESGEER